MEVINDPKVIAELCRYTDKRLSTIYKIVNKQGQAVQFQPNAVQQIINRSTHKRKLLLKARQFGVTTNEVVKMLDFVLWNKNKTACILAHEQDGLKKIFRIAKFARDNLPAPFNMEVDRGGGSMYEMKFPASNSKIYCDLSSRGDTINWLHISECAFVKDPMRVRATMQAVPLDGIITLESTPNGLGNWFYDLWADPNEDYDKIFCPWFLHSEYAIPTPQLTYDDNEVNLVAYVKQKYGLTLSQDQIAFRRAKQKDLKQFFRQEYPEDDINCFLSSGNAAINPEVIQEMRNSAKPALSDEDGLKIYSKCEKHRRYSLAADPAEGYDGDFSVACVLDIQSLEQVAVLRGHFKPHEFAHRIDALAKMYITQGQKYPTVCVERNNHGHAVLLELAEHIQYPALYQAPDGKLGWKTDLVSRPMTIDTFIEAIENKKIKLNDLDTIQECLTLVELNGKIEAGQSKHDDCVFAAALALQICIQESSALFYENIGKMIRI